MSAIQQVLLAGAGDPYYPSVVLLLHASGTNGSTVFVDNSPLALSTSTVFGNAQISTARFKFPPSSAVFDGTGDAVLYAHNSGHHLSTDFTIEGWVYPNATQTSFLMNMGGGTGIGFASFELLLNSGQINFAASSANTSYDIGSETGSTGNIGTVANSTWSHFAVTRAGNVYRGFINGTQNYTQTLALTPFNPTPRGLAVGGNFQTIWGSGTPINSLNGNLDEIRITNGVARYTAAFTPPAAQFPNA